MTVALSGFSTTQRTVIVNAGVNVEVPFIAKVASVAETVTVDAETPVIDSKRMGTGTTLNSDELSKLPNSRDPWAFMRAVPGVQIDRVNQAGSESGQQSGFIGKGSPQTDSMWVLDGVVITDPAAVGASPSYYDFDSFEEVAITTGGADVRVATGGVGINMVTKRGTNAFHGGVSGFYASTSSRPRTCRASSRAIRVSRAATRPTTPSSSPSTAPTSAARSSRTSSGSGAPTASRTCGSSASTRAATRRCSRTTTPS